MSENRLQNPKLFFEQLGGLHDASVTGLLWDSLNKQVSLSIDDLHSNFLGLPEYQGLKPVEIIFLNVREFDFNVQLLDEVLKVYGISARESDDFHFLAVKFSPGGYIQLTCESINIKPIC